MPTLNYPAYFERRFCDECIAVHWVEIARNGRETCHGADFQPTANHPNHYSQHSGHGIELKAKINAVPLEWQILAERPAVLDEVDF